MEILETFTRTYVDLDNFNVTINFYETLFRKKCHFKFDYSERGLKLAAVGSVLIIAGDKENRKGFESTRMTCHVDNLEEVKKILVFSRVKILQDIKKVPTGINMRVRHPDGLVVEYVEHKNIS
jgi:hypothetical protein